MKFEWDEQKNQSNINKHGLNFEDAHKVFEHPMLANLDDREDYGEERWIGIGLLDMRVVVVVFAEQVKVLSESFLSERLSAMNENITNKPTKTNLERLDAMTDDEIDTSDIPPLTDKFFATAKWRMPEPKVTVTIEVDPNVMAWFKAQGENYERYLAAALRIYAEAHQVPEKVEVG